MDSDRSTSRSAVTSPAQNRPGVHAELSGLREIGLALAHSGCRAVMPHVGAVAGSPFVESAEVTRGVQRESAAACRLRAVAPPRRRIRSEGEIARDVVIVDERESSCERRVAGRVRDDVDLVVLRRGGVTVPEKTRLADVRSKV